MNTRTLIAGLSLALAAAAPAFAQEATPDAAPIAGQLSRAEVVAGARQALQTGQLSEVYQITQMAPVAHSRSRATVRAETLAALSNGDVARLDAEAWGVTLPTMAAQSHGAPVTRLSR